MNRFSGPRHAASKALRAFGSIGMRARAVMASIAAIAMMTGMVLVAGPAATAAVANAGITTTLTTSSGSFDRDPVLKTGDTVTLKV